MLGTRWNNRKGERTIVLQPSHFLKLKLDLQEINLLNKWINWCTSGCQQLRNMLAKRFSQKGDMRLVNQLAEIYTLVNNIKPKRWATPCTDFCGTRGKWYKEYDVNKTSLPR